MMAILEGLWNLWGMACAAGFFLFAGLMALLGSKEYLEKREYLSALQLGLLGVMLVWFIIDLITK